MPSRNCTFLLIKPPTPHSSHYTANIFLSRARYAGEAPGKKSLTPSPPRGEHVSRIYLFLVSIAVPSEMEHTASRQVHQEVLPVRKLGKKRNVSARLCHGPASNERTAQQSIF